MTEQYWDHCPYCLQGIPYGQKKMTCGRKLCADRTRVWTRWVSDPDASALPPRMSEKTASLLCEVTS